MDDNGRRDSKSDEKRKIENDTPEKDPEEEFEWPISPLCKKIP
jgi:hypothetical protein